jgi:hypothetical protein
MNFKKVLPFLLVAICWGIYSGYVIKEQMILFYAIGVGLGITLVAWGLAALTVTSNQVDYGKKRYKVFVTAWSVFLAIQVINLFYK